MTVSLLLSLALPIYLAILKAIPTYISNSTFIIESILLVTTKKDYRFLNVLLETKTVPIIPKTYFLPFAKRTRNLDSSLLNFTTLPLNLVYIKIPYL